MTPSLRARTTAGPVTVLAARTARPGREREFAASLERLRQTLDHQPGHLATAIMAPDRHSPDAIVVYRFNHQDSLQAWHASTERAHILAASAEFTLAPPHERSLSALDGWFVAPGGRVVHPPARWKTWLVSTSAIWALLTLITLAAAPLLAPLPAPLRFALIVPVLGAVMTWLVMPGLTRLLNGWLQAAAAGNGSSATRQPPPE